MKKLIKKVKGKWIINIEEDNAHDDPERIQDYPEEDEVCDSWNDPMWLQHEKRERDMGA